MIYILFLCPTMVRGMKGGSDERRVAAAPLARDGARDLSPLSKGASAKHHPEFPPLQSPPLRIIPQIGKVDSNFALGVQAWGGGYLSKGTHGVLIPPLDAGYPRSGVSTWLMRVPWGYRPDGSGRKMLL